ncbi:MAG: DUF2007 domain-containing protein [Deltaproteobacteria bacterium]|nr:DUF2007 domain-containing protein [Deltaproteobacteria bacterium]
MERFVDIYTAAESWAAPLVRDYLAQFGIDALVRSNVVSVYPMAIGPLSGFRVGVRANDMRAAVRLLEQAICDGVIPGEVIAQGEDS